MSTEQKKESTKDECMTAFDKILDLTEVLPLVHRKKMSVEDTITELISIMPEEWQRVNIKASFFEV